MEFDTPHPTRDELFKERQDLRELVQDYGDENSALRVRVAALLQKIADREAEVQALKSRTRETW